MVWVDRPMKAPSMHIRVNVKIRQNSCPFHILWKPLMWSWIFFFTQYYWSYLIRLADKTEKYWCVNMFYWIKTPFFGIYARPGEKIELSTRIIKKTVIFSGIITGCIDKSIIKVNVGGFNMWFFITFFAFFCQKTSVPSVYVKTVTLDKLQK